MSKALTSRPLLLLFLIVFAFLGIQARASLAQTSPEQLEALLKTQYAGIEQEIGAPPARRDFPDTYRLVLRAWQDRLANRFSEAATTVEAILKLNPANSEIWRERLETLRLYSQPISSPDQRSVFGSGEVQKQARIIESPPAVYTDDASANKVKGEVRLRVVLASDGTVRNVFPIKSLSHGLTESAMAAALQLKFEPALRNGAPASQFATFVYEFRNKPATPYIPRTIF